MGRRTADMSPSPGKITGPPAVRRGDNTRMQALSAPVSMSRWLRPRLPVVAAVLAAVSVACAVASLPLYAYNLSHLGVKVHYFYADDLVVGIVYPLVGAFLVRRRPQNAVGWLLILTSVL